MTKPAVMAEQIFIRILDRRTSNAKPFSLASTDVDIDAGERVKKTSGHRHRCKNKKHFLFLGSVPSFTYFITLLLRPYLHICL